MGMLTATPAYDARLDAMFAALADPTRRGIVAQLTGGEATVNELAAPYEISVQAVSQHLRVLEQAGLISRTRLRQTRPCRLEPAALDLAVGWIEQNRRMWSERFDKLDAHLRKIQEPS